jgi:thiol-disulfide isomerase/thioredoxin
LYAADAYKDVKDEYFLTYVRYNIGEMDQTFGGGRNAEARLQIFLEYIGPYPVYYENDQYMTFIKRFYEQDFDGYDPHTEKEIFAAIDAASPTLMMKALKRDLFLANPELREMIMIDKLGKQFYKSNYDKQAILHMLDSLSSHARYQVNATLARNIGAYLTSLERGYPAPFLELPFSADSTLTWRSYEGKFVYLNFFTTWDDKSKGEMKVMEGLYEKYKEDICFLSLCTDKERITFEKYRAENPGQTWDVIYIGDEHSLLQSWKVQTFPAYFLIDQGGYIAAAPATRPSPDGEYESIDKTFFYIRKVLHPERVKGPGEP